MLQGRVRRVVWGIIVVLAWSGAALAQNGRVGGLVREDSGQPVKGATVIAENQAVGQSFTATITRNRARAATMAKAYFLLPSRLVSEPFWWPLRCFSQALLVLPPSRQRATTARGSRRRMAESSVGAAYAGLAAGATVHGQMATWVLGGGSRRIPLPQRPRFAASLRAKRSLIPSSAPRQRRSISRVKCAASSGDSITSSTSSF